MDTEEYVIWNKMLLKTVGLYPINWVRYVVCIITILILHVPQIYRLYLARNDFPAIIETSATMVTGVFVILKSIFWLCNGETRRVVEFLLTDSWRIAESVNMKNRMKGYAKWAKYMTRGYFIIMMNTLLIFFTLQPLKSVVSKSRDNYQVHSQHQGKTTFPFPAAYPTFCYESPFYEITYGSHITASVMACVMIAAMDTTIGTALFHTCGHLKILHDNILNLDNYIDQVEYAESKKIQEASRYFKEASMKLKNKIATVINHHQLVIRFADGMEKAFNPITLLQVLNSSSIICLVGFQASSSTISTSYRPVEYMSYLVVTLFQIVIFCWPGGEVILHSSKIGDAAFSIKWYKAPKQLKSVVCLIIVRSQKPNCLTAGKFRTMSMEYFTVIMSAAWSYLMLLRTINSE